MHALARHGLGAVGAAALLPLGLVALLVRPRWRVGWRERLGAAPRSDAASPAPIWVHAASVGEVQAALRLTDRLQARGDAVLLSTTTATGWRIAQETRPALPSTLAPLDHPWSVARALGRARPGLLVLIETELWPSWIAACARRGVPVVMTSARLSDRSFPRYQQLARWLRPTLSRIAAIGARTREDAERFEALGCDPEHVVVTGDLKLEAASPPGLDPLLAKTLAATSYWVAGSTHPGEEVAAFDASEELRRRGHRLALVVAPRHPERREAAFEALIARGAKVRRRSALDDGATLGDGDVLLLDTLGELSGVYPGAVAAFVGGTLVPVGGHNLLEALAAGTPVAYGPHTANVRSHTQVLEETGAGAQVEDAASLAESVDVWLRDATARDASLARGQEALLAHRGAAARSLDLIDRVRAIRDESRPERGAEGGA